jgi:hypothetical protein
VRIYAVPDFTGMVPDVERVDAQVNYPSVSTAWPGLPDTMIEDFAARWTGQIEIPTTGDWTFSTNSDDGTFLYIDDVLVVSNDGKHGMTEKSGTVSGLTAGRHDIRIEYFECYGGAGCIASWAGPGVAKEVIPATVLFHLGPGGPVRAIIMDNPDGFVWDCVPAGTASHPTGQTQVDDLDATADHVLSPVPAPVN